MATRNEVRQANAQARSAEAQAKAAEAAARVQEAQTRARQSELVAAREAARDAQLRDPVTIATKLGSNAVAPLAGMYAGARYAKSVEMRHLTSLKAQNTEIKALAKRAGQFLPKATGRSAKVPLTPVARAQLKGVVNTASRARLGRPAPLALGVAAVLLAEGAYARFVLKDQVDNPAAKEAIGAAGNAFAFAATSLVAKRIIANKTAPKIASTAGLATIEAARQMVTTPAGRAAVAVGRVAMRALPVVSAAAAAYGAYEGFKKAGVKGAVVGAVTGGYVPPSMMPTTGPARVASARVAIARSAALRSTLAQGRTAVLGRAARTAVVAPRSDGTTQGYTAVRGGKSVNVQGYTTPKRSR